MEFTAKHIKQENSKRRFKMSVKPLFKILKIWEVQEWVKELVLAGREWWYYVCYSSSGIVYIVRKKRAILANISYFVCDSD